MHTEPVKIILTVTGDRCSGKSTVLRIIKDALESRGFEVSELQAFGEEVVKEYVVVTTAKVSTKKEWLGRER